MYFNKTNLRMIEERETDKPTMNVGYFQRFSITGSKAAKAGPWTEDLQMSTELDLMDVN